LWWPVIVVRGENFTTSFDILATDINCTWKAEASATGGNAWRWYRGLTIRYLFTKSVNHLTKTKSWPTNRQRKRES